MCYSIYLSTDCPRDLAAESFVHLRFEKPLDEELKPALRHPHQWFLTRREYGGCSCHFRHSEYDPRFDPPQDWMPEDEDDVLATREAYRVFRGWVADGYQLDLIDVSDINQHETDFKNLLVPLSSISEESFRFFWGYHFDFRP